MIKKVFRSKLGKAVALTAMALALVVSGKSLVKAGASQDFEFVFAGNYYWDVTDELAKNNTSYVSMKCTDAEIDGSCYDAVVVSIPGAAQSCPAPYRFYEGTYHLMANSVYEDGYRTTRIDAYCVDDVYGEGAIFSGYWYADSDIY